MIGLKLVYVPSTLQKEGSCDDRIKQAELDGIGRHVKGDGPVCPTDSSEESGVSWSASIQLNW